MLEPYDGKLSRTVLRRESGSNPADLADIIFGGFAPNSGSAEVLSKALGSRTVMSGSVSRSKNDPSQSLQMIERPLMTPDELKSMPKGQFVVMKTGYHPMKVNLKLYFDWGIQFDEEYSVPENGNRKVAYAEKNELLQAIVLKYHPDWLKADEEESKAENTPAGGQNQEPPKRNNHNRASRKEQSGNGGNRPLKEVAPHNREVESEVTADGPV